jgi:UDP-N-acetylmuramyl pentapeptide phosphotransferase/UDP-N-acetylglucosamine-1-phosphate transferase
MAPLFLASQSFNAHFCFILLGMTLIFLNGLGDDLFKYSAKQKLFIHFLVCSTFIDSNGIVQNYLQELFDSYYISRVFLSVILVTIINSINLLDGIDGLAGTICIFILLVFGFLNILHGDIFLSVLSISLLGSLTGFMCYNINPAKIFMGDSGALLSGFVIGMLTISTPNFSHPALSNFPDDLIIKIILGAISIPVLDLLRLFFVRMSSGKSPFNGDRNHLHHILVDAGVPTKTTVLIILLMSIIHVILAFLLADLSLIMLGVFLSLEYVLVVAVLKRVFKPSELVSK